MEFEVPPDFDKPWRMSDVVICTNNSDGKDIHAYKGALAMFSPYFNVIFFGGFKEKSDASVNVYCDRDVMVEILRNIHQIGFNYNVAPKPYESEMLVKLYKAADLYDFPFIRKMCYDHMEGYPSVAMFQAADQLELDDIRTRILMKLKKEEVDELLHRSKSLYHFTKEEFLFLFQTEVGQPLPKASVDSDEKGVLNLEEITDDLANPRVDITNPWPTANLAIIADNAMGKILYANKTVVAMMCHKLKKYCRKTDHVIFPEVSVKFVAHIDEEYTAMKEILSIIHMCNMSYKSERILHPALIHAMYCAADEDRLDIPIVRNFCFEMLEDQKSINSLEVLCRLDPFPVSTEQPMCKLLGALSTHELRNWIY